MCGIFGIQGNCSEKKFLTTLEQINHRGPDDSGYQEFKNVNLKFGHKRLSIVDIKHGKQPMYSSDRNLCVIYNGEIYNHLELRKELIKKKYKFNTSHSDTEILLYGYKEWGKNLTKKLNGMFAFAIYDKKNQQIFIARDRFGEKPLYWCYYKEKFVFGSELTLFKSIFNPDIDRKSLQKFFVYNFIPSPRTFYANINKLPGGNQITFDIRSRKILQEKYWEFRIKKIKKFVNFNEACEELRFLLKKSIKARLMSDVPIGVFLSGGIDSSIVSIMTNQLIKEKIKTFNIGFNEDSYDESKYAKEVSQIIKSNHFCNILSEKKIIDTSPKILKFLDEPNGDPSFIPTFYVSKLASKEVKVILTGDGGDELFAGYDTFSALSIAKICERLLPPAVINNLTKLIDLFPKSNKNMSLEFKMMRGLRGIGHGARLWNQLWLSSIEINDLIELFNEKIEYEEIFDESIAHWNQSESKNLVDRTSEFFVKFYLQEGVLPKVDRASMLNSIETRAVFLDNDIASFAENIPHHYKLKNNNKKYILKKANQDILPKNILYRKKKGFGIPLRNISKNLKINKNNKFLSTDFISKKYISNQKNKDHRNFLWNVLVAQSISIQ